MLSDLSCNTFSFDIPMLPDSDQEQDPLAPLNFDDLLDIAHEFEFMRPITHVWPSEEPGACSQTVLDDILAVITTEGNSLSLPNTINPAQIQSVDPSILMHPMSDANASVSPEPTPPSTNDGQLPAEAQIPTVAVLRGWSPPNGFQFLDLNDNLMVAQSVRETWIPPWFTAITTPPSTQPVESICQSPATAIEMSTVQLRTWENGSKIPPVNKTSHDPTEENVPSTPLLEQRATLVPTRARPLQIDSNVPVPAAAHARSSKSRPYPPSAPTTYAKAPRGGIPPYIARTVTKANVLRVEKERKMARDAFSSTAREGKKPSVLERTARVERVTNKGSNGKNSSKKPFTQNENEKGARATKRKRE